MKTLYLRIYATLVVLLLLFAAASGWLFQQHLDHERKRAELVLTERMSAWGELIQRSLPGHDASVDDQAAALLDWSSRLRLPLALDRADGQRIVASPTFLQRQQDGTPLRGLSVQLEDGRTLWMMRPGARPGLQRQNGTGEARLSAPNGSGDARLGAPGGSADIVRPGVGPRLAPTGMLALLWPTRAQQGVGLVIVLVLLFIAVAAGAYPVVRRLTRRLEALKQGVEQFGAGQLDHRVAVHGHDEVAAVASSFNVAAQRVEALVRSHQSLLANASHELRSPLARMKMAVSLLDDTVAPDQRERLKREIDTNVAELDALVEEVLLASRLNAAPQRERDAPVELLGIAAEEAARVNASVAGAPLTVFGDERLLRRAMRNLLENATRYGGGEVEIEVDLPLHAAANPLPKSLPDTSPNTALNGLPDSASDAPATRAVIRVTDRGPGVPQEMRERIFEPFFRLPGHAEQAGGVGLGLSLVQQIAQRHGGSVRCEPRPGGGSCFVLELAR